MSSNPFQQERLFCPGPTPIPLATALASVNASVYHRSEEFYSHFKQCQTFLKPFFGTKNNPIILTSSGTGAMEAALSNLTQETDKVLVVEGGKFGERWRKIAEHFGCQVETIQVEWGGSPTLQQFEQALKKAPDVKAIFMQANETSTGVFYPLQELIPEIRRKTEALIVVDAISALVAHEINMDQLGIDCLLSGSQKGFGVPPGLAFIALSDRAWGKLSSRHRYYFDLKRERDNQEKGATAYTPAVSLIYGLLDAAKKLHDFGVKECADHHARLAQACRKATGAMGLKLFPKSHPSNALTAVEIPEAVMKKGLMGELKRMGMVFAGGQDHLKGKIIRISHLGFVDEFALLGGIGALELALVRCGHKFELGSGSAKFLQSIAE